MTVGYKDAVGMSCLYSLLHTLIYVSKCAIITASTVVYVYNDEVLAMLVAERCVIIIYEGYKIMCLESLNK